MPPKDQLARDVTDVIHTFDSVATAPATGARGLFTRAICHLPWVCDPVYRRYVGLFLVLLGLYCAGNATLPLIDRDEPRFAEASREMLQSGDWILPRVNGEYRFDKPPFIYWCQATAMAVLGQDDFAARLPSAVFAAATAVLTGAWGRRWRGERVGWVAALVFGTALQVFVHARAAVADMPMVFFFAAAAWAGWERLQRPTSPGLWVAFYLALALGFLAKGPIALLPLVTPFLHARFQGGERRPVSWASVGGGLIFVAAIVGVWGIPALVQTHGEFFRVGIGKHVVQRSLEPMESHGAPGLGGYLLFLPFYLITIPFSFAPWSILLPATLRRACCRPASMERYLLLTISLVFAIFTLIQTKLPHYLLPVFPLLALLVAGHIRPDFPATRIAAATAGVYLLVATAGFASIEPAFPSKMLVQELRPYLRSETRTASVGYDEQSLVWYFRSTCRPFHRRLRPSDVASFMAEPGPAVCVFAVADLNGILLDPHWTQVRYGGLNFARWKLQPVSVLPGRPRLPLPQRVALVALLKGEGS